jgi:pullulanase
MSNAIRGRWFVASFLALLLATALPVAAQSEPASVTVAGNMQAALGCPGDWQPECLTTALAFDSEDGVWQASFALPAGNWEYKAALNGSWDLNYGANATRNGANIALNLHDPATVKFYYSDRTHWITDNRNAVIAVAPGNFQTALGCSNDWDPSCLASWLQDPEGDGVYGFEAWLPAGDYEAKVALNESWDLNYGAGGEQNGANIAFSVPAGDGGGSVVGFFYDSVSHLLSIDADAGGTPPQVEPDSVTIAGNLQTALGCPGDWQPECTLSQLQFDAEDGVWQARFALPAGQWEYKAALDGSWEVNYGANASAGGANIGLALDQPTAVKFYYSHRTHWITDDRNATIAVVAGSFQQLLGCNNDWDPSCLRSWLQDPQGSGIHSFSARLPAGNYQAKVAHDESWDLNFGAGGEQNGANIEFSVPPGDAIGTEVFFFYDPASHVLTISLSGIRGDLRRSRAHWLDADTIAWDPALPAGAVVRLHADPDAGLALDPGGVAGGQALLLSEDPAGLSTALRARFPHLAQLRAFKLPALTADATRPLLKGQLAVSAVDADGAPIDATGVQIPGALDALFGYDGALGPLFDDDGIALRLWAPTAQSVELLLFEGPAESQPSAVLPMLEDAASGVWTITGPLDWDRRYYLYQVSVYAPSTGRIEHNRVTDPYSLSLAADGSHSQIVDLRAADLAPPGWQALQKPALPAPNDIVVYELHVRDFSISDASMPEADRGKFTAFTRSQTTGMRHLRRLADAGLSHVHLLPVFDFATVPERAEDRREPAGDLAAYPPDSEYQQAAIDAVRDLDGFNWGYDPVHFTVPEGSYATDPDGVARIIEFRAMVQALNQSGLRVVKDVVYNHTSSAGQNPRSVLDKIVPGYYHRLNRDGAIEMSSCCPNTASEHRMMEKLMIDSVLTWARMYKVDGFRFDLMGHHMKSNMLNLRAALDALTVEADGVDGRAIYLYGEGWNFGEVANNARGVNAIQRNMAGTGIGTFNDRLRDGIRGGSPFSGIRDQGFINGLFHEPNGTDQGDQRARLLQVSDWLRVGLAGTLADYELIDAHGNHVRAAQIDYFGQPAGYTASPQEDISYSAKHDNETLFDVIQLKAASSASLAERIRMHRLGLSLIGLGQGIPFFHAGQEMLRSKSLDRDSYNSGDWFNVIDYSFQSHGWGRGLPVAEKNQHHWPLMRPLLADPTLKPEPADLAATAQYFEELLRIRSSSPLFRLRSADEVRSHLAFHNTGPGQVPGLIVKSLADPDGRIDRRHALIVTLFNAGIDAVQFPFAADRPLQLHPLQQQSVDPALADARFDGSLSAFIVPARSTAVFVSPRPAVERIALLAEDVRQLQAQGAINAGQAQSLLARLDNASRLAESGQTRAAANMLGAFAQQASALGLPAALGEEANEIRRQLLGR